MMDGLFQILVDVLTWLFLDIVDWWRYAPPEGPDPGDDPAGSGS